MFMQRVITTLLLLMSMSNALLAKKAKIGFFINYLSVRGTEVSTYDYADFNETLLENESIIINYTAYNHRHENDPKPYCSVQEKFKKRFGARYYECATLQEMDQILLKEGVEILYQQKAGAVDGKVSHVCKNAVHAVFPELQPHGDMYGCISRWLSSTYPWQELPYVPYMVHLDETTDSLHRELGIPYGAVVFGRHGGADSFDIAFAKEAIREVAEQKKDWYFLFLNTDKFCDLPNVIFLPATAEMVYKTKFINTCDAMIHARDRGETFGLACAEFSVKNKPVITWIDSPERSHIETLGDKGLYFRSKQDLLNILIAVGNNILKVRSLNWDAYSKEYNPHVVIKQFNDVFIRPLMK